MTCLATLLALLANQVLPPAIVRMMDDAPSGPSKISWPISAMNDQARLDDVTLLFTSDGHQAKQ